MIVLSEQPELIKRSNPILIYKPKAKKVYKSNPNYSLFHFPSNSFQILNGKKKEQKLDLDLKKKTKSEKFNVESISLEEMEKDFKRLQTKREITKVERELKQIMEDSSKNDKQKNKKIKGIKRPKNIKYILYKDFDIDFE